VVMELNPYESACKFWGVVVLLMDCGSIVLDWGSTLCIIRALDNCNSNGVLSIVVCEFWHLVWCLCVRDNK